MDCIIKTLKKWTAPFLNLVYPPLCLHCSLLLPSRGPLLCALCFQQLDLLERRGRCPICFAELGKGPCQRCISRPRTILHQIAACEAMGVARTLVRGVEAEDPACLKAAASLMAYQWLKCERPLPTLLVPMPGSSLPLAYELGKLFERPVALGLKKKFDTQRFLTQGELGCQIVARTGKTESLSDAHVLLVAPQLEDDALQSAALALKPFFPAQIEALAFACW